MAAGQQRREAADRRRVRDKRDEAARVQCQARDCVSTLDYWRSKRKPKLVRVAVEPQQPGPGFVLVLASGRRIESSWRFAEADLLRLIRAAEA
jgi:hypothetical protein